VTSCFTCATRTDRLIIPQFGQTSAYTGHVAGWFVSRTEASRTATPSALPPLKTSRPPQPAFSGVEAIAVLRGYPAVCGWGGRRRDCGSKLPKQRNLLAARYSTAGVFGRAQVCRGATPLAPGARAAVECRPYGIWREVFPQYPSPLSTTLRSSSPARYRLTFS